MDNTLLRKNLVRLAHEKPELREKLVPLLKKTAGANRKAFASKVKTEFKIIVDHIEKTTTEDFPDSGASGKSSIEISKSNLGSFGSFSEVVGFLQRQYDFPGSKENWNAFEPGRVTTNRSETDSGSVPDTTETLGWQKGEQRLFLADYNVWFHFARVYTPSEKEISKVFKIPMYD